MNIMLRTMKLTFNKLINIFNTIENRIKYKYYYYNIGAFYKQNFHIKSN